MNTESVERRVAKLSQHLAQTSIAKKPLVEFEWEEIKFDPAMATVLEPLGVPRYYNPKPKKTIHQMSNL